MRYPIPRALVAWLAMVVLVPLLFVGAPVTLQAQPTQTLPSSPYDTVAVRQLMSQADAAWSSGDRVLAASRYRAILALQPLNSRAVYRVAALETPGSSAALAGFRLYVLLEPDDVWGSIALGDALVDAGNLVQALEVYDTAVARAPEEHDAIVGRARVLQLLGREEEAISAAGPFRDELAAPGRPMSTPIGWASSSRPSSPTTITPAVGTTWDTDGNTSVLTSIALEVPLGEPLAFGFLAERVTADGPEGSQSIDRARLLVRWRASTDVRIDGNVGVAVNEKSLRTGRGPQPRPIGRLRVRWNPGPDAIGGELRLQRSTVDASTTLMENRVMLEEGRMMARLPLGGALRLHAELAAGAMAEQKSRNMRWRAGGGPVLQTTPALALGLSGMTGGYERSSRAGYFAPSLMQTLEFTASLEVEELGPFALSADVGAGAQRAAIESEPAGAWGPAFRGWASLSWSFARASALSLELEAYSSTISPEVASVAERWSYASAILAVRVSL